MVLTINLLYSVYLRSNNDLLTLTTSRGVGQ